MRREATSWRQTFNTNYAEREGVRERKHACEKAILWRKACTLSQEPPWMQPRGKWMFFKSTPIQIPPRRGGICGKLTYDLPSTRLQGGFQPHNQKNGDVVARLRFWGTPSTKSNL
jgi:hypothetical protein